MLIVTPSRFNCIFVAAHRPPFFAINWKAPSLIAPSVPFLFAFTVNRSETFRLLSSMPVAATSSNFAFISFSATLAVNVDTLPSVPSISAVISIVADRSSPLLPFRLNVSLSPTCTLTPLTEVVVPSEENRPSQPPLNITVPATPSVTVSAPNVQVLSVLLMLVSFATSSVPSFNAVSVTFVPSTDTSKPDAMLPFIFSAFLMLSACSSSVAPVNV